MRGPTGWHAVIVQGELFGLFPSQTDAEQLARRLAPSFGRVSVVPVVDDASLPLDGLAPTPMRSLIPLA